MKQCLSLVICLLVASISIASLGSGDAKTDCGFKTELFSDNSFAVILDTSKESSDLAVASGIFYADGSPEGKSVPVFTDLAFELEKEYTRSHEPTCFGYINKVDISALQFG